MNGAGRICPPRIRLSARAAAESFGRPSGSEHLDEGYAAVHQADFAGLQAERQVLTRAVAVGIADEAVVKEHQGGVQGNILLMQFQNHICYL